MFHPNLALRTPRDQIERYGFVHISLATGLVKKNYTAPFRFFTLTRKRAKLLEDCVA
jgi:hypothetical protein